MTGALHIVEVNFLKSKTLANSGIADHRVVLREGHYYTNSSGKCVVPDDARSIHVRGFQCIDEKVAEMIFPNLAYKPGGRSQPCNVVSKDCGRTSKSELHVLGVLEFPQRWQGR